MNIIKYPVTAGTTAIMIGIGLMPFNELSNLSRVFVAGGLDILALTVFGILMYQLWFVFPNMKRGEK